SVERQPSMVSTRMARVGMRPPSGQSPSQDGIGGSRSVFMALPGNCDYYLNPWIQVVQRRVKADGTDGADKSGGRGGRGGREGATLRNDDLSVAGRRSALSLPG